MWGGRPVAGYRLRLRDAPPTGSAPRGRRGWHHGQPRAGLPLPPPRSRRPPAQLPGSSQGVGWDIRRADCQRVDGTLCPARRRGDWTGGRCVPTSVRHGPSADRSGIPGPAVRHDYDPRSSEAVGPAGAVAQSVRLPPGVGQLSLGGAEAGMGRVLPRAWTAAALCGRVL